MDSYRTYWVVIVLLLVAAISLWAAAEEPRAAATRATALPAASPVTSPASHPSTPPSTQATTVRIPATTVTFDLIRLPAGQIALPGKAGKPVVHPIKPFWIGRTEVTWEEFDVLFLGLNFDWGKDPHVAYHKSLDAYLGPSPKPYLPPDRGFGHSGWPVIGLTLRSSKGYCRWLTDTLGRTYRLPTEAEWEYACRAGADRPYKPDRATLEQVAWFEKNANEQTQRVGKKLPNAWGLHDMLGNAAEYVIRDPEDAKGLVAGGSFEDEADDVHSGARQRYGEKWQRDDPRDPKGKVWLSNGAHVGLRIVCEDEDPRPPRDPATKP